MLELIALWEELLMIVCGVDGAVAAVIAVAVAVAAAEDKDCEAEVFLEVVDVLLVEGIKVEVAVSEAELFEVEVITAAALTRVPNTDNGGVKGFDVV